MQTLLQDVRFGLRMLARNPGFTAVAIITLALGIGGTTAIFSVVQGALLDPFPYADSHRLAVLVSHDTRQGQFVAWSRVPAPEFLDYQRQNRVFDDVIGGAGDGLLLTGTSIPEWLEGARVTENTFHVLGVAPLIGRPLTPEDSKPGAPPVAVLSHKAWQSKFGGDPGIVGRTVVLNHQPTTVVGVMPPRFDWCSNVCLPADLSKADDSGQILRFSVVGHLKAGITIEQAKANVTILAQRFAPVYPKEHPPEVTFTVESLPDAAVGEFRKTLYILLGAVGFLMLIACVNVANLLLARATAREKETAIRAALGASRSRLVRQFLIESSLLAFGGALLGCLLAANGVDGLAALFPPGSLAIPSEAVIGINRYVLLFTLATALFSTLLFGLAPALLAVSKDLQVPLKGSGRGTGESLSHNRLRNLLMVSEVALSLVLLMGAGLLFRSFWALQHVELGYSVGNVLRAGAGLSERYKTAEQRNQFHLEILRRVRALPGVVSAALGWPSLNWAMSATIQVTGQSSVESQSAWFRLAGDRFFETLGIPLLEGRGISEEDLVHARPVAVVNRAFVNRYFTGKSPLGRQIKVTTPPWFKIPMKEAGFEIVGVIADTTHSEGEGPEVRPQLFLPSTVGGIAWDLLFIQTAGNPASLANTIRREFASMDKELPVEAVPMRDDFRDWYSEPQFVLGMVVGFAALGLTLVCIGVYSVLSYAVSRRTQEIGIRMALGAQVTDVRRMVITSGLRWLAVGIGIGVPASIALVKILQNRIWGIKSADPLTLLTVAVLLTLVGLAACYIPARRATKVEPMEALRYE